MKKKSYKKESGSLLGVWLSYPLEVLRKGKLGTKKTRLRILSMLQEVRFRKAWLLVEEAHLLKLLKNFKVTDKAMILKTLDIISQLAPYQFPLNKSPQTSAKKTV